MAELRLAIILLSYVCLAFKASFYHKNSYNNRAKTQPRLKLLATSDSKDVLRIDVFLCVMNLNRHLRRHKRPFATHHQRFSLISHTNTHTYTYRCKQTCLRLLFTWPNILADSLWLFLFSLHWTTSLSRLECSEKQSVKRGWFGKHVSRQVG